MASYDTVSRECIPCDSCGKPGAKLKCSRCKGAHYCGKVCQKKDWKAHKPKFICVPASERMNRMKRKQDVFDGKLYYSEEGLTLATKTVAKNTKCSICLKDPIVAPVLVNRCRHAFCSPCLYKWQQQQNTNCANNPTNPNRIVVDNLFDGKEPQPFTLGSVPHKCPTCKEGAGPDIVINIMVAHGQVALQKAKTGGHLEKEALVQELAKLDEFLAGGHEVDYAVYATKAQILLFLQKPQEALDCLAEFDKLHTNGANWKATSPDGFGMQLLEAKALIQKQDYETALSKCQLKSGMPMNYTAIRQTHQMQAECYYHLGDYDDVIDAIDTLLGMPNTFNRHYPGVHKYKALAQQKMGNLHAALVTANQAVVYETPWEEAVGVPPGETALDLYNQLQAKEN